MRLFISYRFTGEDPHKLKTILGSIQKALESTGHSNYCSFDWQGHFEKNSFSNAKILEHSLKQLDDADTILVFINSSEKSEGMLLEVGYALGKKKKIYLLIREGVKTNFVREIADKVIEFKDSGEIPKLLSGL